MLSWRPILLCAALAPLAAGAGCGANRAAAPPPAQWTRPVTHDPWWAIGVSPNASWIERALEATPFYEFSEGCWVHVDGCRNTAGTHRSVDEVACAAVSGSRDRCSFRMVETVMGNDGKPIRSVHFRCTGVFTPQGTSHSPPEWGVLRDNLGHQFSCQVGR